MIVRLDAVRTGRDSSTGVPVLDELHDIWEALRGNDPLPEAESLFLSALIELMPHILLAYRHGRAFRIEFAGDVACRLVGSDPIGACPTRCDPDPVRAGLARGLAASEALRSAGAGRVPVGGSAVAAVYLPFVDRRAGRGRLTAMRGVHPGPSASGIAMVLVGLAEAPSGASGDVVPFAGGREAGRGTEG